MDFIVCSHLIAMYFTNIWILLAQLTPCFKLTGLQVSQKLRTVSCQTDVSMGDLQEILDRTTENKKDKESDWEDEVSDDSLSTDVGSDSDYEADSRYGFRPFR